MASLESNERQKSLETPQPNVPLPGNITIVPNLLPKTPVKVFTRFNPEDVVIDNVQYETEGLFSDKDPNLMNNEIFTSSIQDTRSGDYYIDIYKTNPNPGAGYDPNAAVQFSIAYGHRLGYKFDVSPGREYYAFNTPPAAVYSQARNILLPPDDPVFTFKGGISSDEIYVLSFKRNRIKDKIDPGNFQINFVHSSSIGYRIISFIDDSNASLAVDTSNKHRVLNLVSGSLVNGVAVPHESNNNFPSYGLVYPDLGLIIFNAVALYSNNTAVNSSEPLFFHLSGNPTPNNNMNHKFYHLMISSSAYLGSLSTPLPLMLFRNEKKVNVSHYFINIKNLEYNYSNNPTFVTGSDGVFSQPDFFRDPKTYITTIGLYNDRFELLAVAKLSKPLLKDFSTERHIRVNLQY